MHGLVVSASGACYLPRHVSCIFQWSGVASDILQHAISSSESVRNAWHSGLIWFLKLPPVIRWAHVKRWIRTPCRCAFKWRNDYCCAPHRFSFDLYFFPGGALVKCGLRDPIKDSQTCLSRWDFTMFLSAAQKRNFISAFEISISIQTRKQITTMKSSAPPVFTTECTGEIISTSITFLR